MPSVEVACRDEGLLEFRLAAFLERLKAVFAQAHPGFELRVVETLRTAARQEWLYASGRTRPGPKVTWTLRSRHLANERGLSEAADVGVFHQGAYLGGGTIYDEMVELGLKVGQESGIKVRSLSPRETAHWELV